MTMSGRRRYLPAINSTNAYAKCQSERQTVNTSVQGSAADLMKMAMNNIDARLARTFGASCLKRGHGRGGGGGRGEGGRANNQRGGFLVLQLHDELLYEVCRGDVDVVVDIIRNEMENVAQLAVKLPVKVKVGASWGSLDPQA